jgi:DNA primase
MDKGLIEYIKQTVDPEFVASSVGLSLESYHGRVARACCPFHHGKNKTSFVMDLDSGNWHCFSAGCHHGYSDIIGLVELSLHCNFTDALKYLASLAGINPNGDYSALAQTALAKKDISDFIRRTEKNNLEMDLCTISNIEELLFQWNQDRPRYFYEQGYTQAIQDYFEVGGHYDKFGIPRACFPIRDLNGRVVAWDGRRTDSNEEPRYLIQPDGFPKRKVLYHYHKAKDYMRAFNGDLYIVEGYKACWSMVQAGYLNTVACMGAGLVDDQISLLLKNLALRRLIFVLDGDTAGRNGSRRMKRKIGYLCDLVIIDMPDDQDPSTVDPNFLHTFINQNLNRRND